VLSFFDDDLNASVEGIGTAKFVEHHFWILIHWLQNAKRNG
jgi:hypothetical protein